MTANVLSTNEDIDAFNQELKTLTVSQSVPHEGVVEPAVEFPSKKFMHEFSSLQLETFPLLNTL